MPTPRTVLMLSANPKGTTPLRLDEELREVKEGLIKRSKLRDSFSLVSEHAVRTRDLHRAMLEHQPHILHFSGHGVGAQGLLLEDEVGGGKTVSGEAIAQLLGLFKESLQCVVLNACYSEVQAKAISEHIPFVIGMSDEIEDKAAIEFAVAFYDAIGAGRDIRFAFDLATVAIKLAGIDQDHVPVLLGKEPESKLAFSTYNPDTFTGREEETRVICEQLQRGSRIVAIVGMTGVGKTALAERAIAQLAGEGDLPYVRFSLDDRSIGVEFSNGGAALLRELGDEPTLEDQKDPSNLVGHIVSRLQSHPCRLQIDSMERLLQGDEQDGWSEFCDPLWLSLFQRVLAAGQCGSQVILTTQDVPGELEGVGDRFNQLWFCQTLQGLSEQEQVELFGKLELVDEGDRLQQIGQFYDGHPLVLQVIADEIKDRRFNGSVDAYWKEYGQEFEAVTPQGKVDRSRVFRTRVRHRVEQTIESLPESAKQLLSACSVFRRPVPETFWIEMGDGDDPYIAFDLLKGRNLVEYVDVAGQASLVQLHNLIRSVAYGLLRGDLEVWEKAERKAAELWLTAYVAPDDASNIETVRGYLEAFEHFCEMGDWEKAKKQISHQLQIWGRYQEMLTYHLRLTGHLEALDEVVCRRWIGNAYFLLREYFQATTYYQESLDLAIIASDKQSQGITLLNLGNILFSAGKYAKSIEYYQQALIIARDSSDHLGEGNALGNIGMACYHIGQYQKAIDFSQKHFAIAKEIGDRLGEGTSLGNLGNTYFSLGHYQRAIDFHQQRVTVAREIGDRLGEGSSLGNLGLNYFSLGHYRRAIDFYQQHSAITKEIGDRLGESIALVNMARTYNKLDQLEQALHFNQQALAIKQEIGDRLGKGIALNIRGDIQRKLKQYPDSLANTQAALKIFQDIGDRANEAEALLNLAKLHYDTNDTTQALQLCQKALAIASELGIPLKAECETLLRELNGEE